MALIVLCLALASNMGPVLALAFALLAVALVIRTLRLRRQRSPQRLPPGPKGLPIIGNLLQTPSELLFLKLADWAEEYGPLYSYSILGQPLIVMSGLKEASDILDRLSAKTSDRPPLLKLNEYLCRNGDFAFQPHNELWRSHRRAAHESLNVRAVTKYHSMQEEEARLLIQGLFEHPEMDVVKHLQRYSSSLAWRSLYGRETIPLEGPDPSAPMEKFFKQIMLAIVPGGSIVDIAPVLHPIIARSKFLRRQSDRFYEEASAFFVKAHSDPQVEGTVSLSSHLKDTGDKLGVTTAHAAGWLGASLFIAAQDTTATSLRWFFVAMVLYPETVTAARAQLQAVVGDRAPTFADQDSLPLIEAILKELLRWRPPAPTGVAHMATENITYGEYVIPQGAILVPNTWSIVRDPSLYPNPDTFDPSRFLGINGEVRTPPPDTHEDYLAFGHGRRICIGKNLALSSLWIAIAQLLWAFDFKLGTDENGIEVVPDPLAFWDNGATFWPKPFRHKLVPRFADLAERIKLGRQF